MFGLLSFQSLYLGDACVCDLVCLCIWQSSHALMCVCVCVCVCVLCLLPAQSRLPMFLCCSSSWTGSTLGTRTRELLTSMLSHSAMCFCVHFFVIEIVLVVGFERLQKIVCMPSQE